MVKRTYCLEYYKSSRQRGNNRVIAQLKVNVLGLDPDATLWYL